MYTLHNDLRTLKACSLTCKAMFASTRHLIHQTLSLTLQNAARAPTQEEKSHNRRKQSNDNLRFLPHMREQGLLQYVRRVYIIDPSDIFTPKSLEYHLHHFQSLDRVHTLTIYRYSACTWARHYNTCFVPFYSTLTSLTLLYALGGYRLLLEFALQFPSLQNLCLEWCEDGHRPSPGVPVYPQSPPLSGHLRLAGYGALAQELMDISHGLPNGMNFRSIELGHIYADKAQRVLNACAHSLGDLTIEPCGAGTRGLHFLS